MTEESKWEKCQVTCPEDKITAELLVEWRKKDGKLVANSVSCNNAKLMDLKPVDCEWSCWGEVEKNRNS